MDKINVEVTQKIKECIDKKFERLDLGQCGLTSVPSEIWKMSWLKELILGNNPTVPDDYEFLKLDEKSYLRVFPDKDKMTLNTGQLNRFSSNENLLLSQLPDLQYLNVYGVGSLSLIELNSSRQLSILIAGENRLISLPGSFSNQSLSGTLELEKIEVLDFGGYENSYRSEMFRPVNADNLRYLNLSNFK